MQNVLNVTRILQKEFEDDAWRIESPRSLNLLKKLQSTGKSLGEYVNGKFYRGIVTGYNNAFVVDHITKERLIKEHDSSKDILKPFIRGRDVKRWNIDKPDLWLIFTRRGVDINTYPAIHNYLKKYKERLKSGVKGGRKPGKYEWFEIQDSIAYHEKFKKPKIVYQEIATYQRFAFDDTGTYTSKTTFFIPTEDLALIAFLNSSVGWWFLKNTCTSVGGGALTLQGIYVEQIPSIDVFVDRKKPIIELTKRILAIEAADPEADVSALETEIDARVAHLYGLTEEEYSLILSETDTPDHFRTAALNAYRDLG